MGASLGLVSSGLGLIKSLTGSNSADKAASKAAKSSAAATKYALDQQKKNEPFLDALRSVAPGLIPLLNQNVLADLTSAAQYDPHKDTMDFTRLYDQEARQSLGRELSAGQVPTALRGFAPGSSSIDNGAVSTILGNRALDRAKAIGEVRMGEATRKLQRTGEAFGRGQNAFQLFNPVTNTTPGSQTALGAAGSYGNIANTYENRASSYDPSGAITGFSGALSELLKKKK